MIILKTYDIWSLFRSGTDTYISNPREFRWSTSFSVDYQWYETVVGRLLKYEAVLIIIIE